MRPTASLRLLPGPSHSPRMRPAKKASLRSDMIQDMETPEAQESSMATMAVHLSYMRKDMESMNRKLDSLANTFVSTDDFQKHIKISDDHETRIRILEEFKDTLTGKLIGAAAVMGIVFTLGTYALDHFLR